MLTPEEEKRIKYLEKKITKLEEQKDHTRTYPYDCPEVSYQNHYQREIDKIRFYARCRDETPL